MIGWNVDKVCDVCYTQEDCCLCASNLYCKWLNLRTKFDIKQFSQLAVLMNEAIPKFCSLGQAEIKHRKEIGFGNFIKT